MKRYLIAVIALAIGASAAWAGHRTCFTHCDQTGYCATSCYDY